ncbi:hypothetical protein K7X08_008120 [Anisodus acutangulus]|uniref:Mannosyltransferase n=1 Tax=Anisodus acutangulus TaxID=402998 RepID=A0A9Q1MPT8_9SOLA|nr:hypothetical protein K7X08_008120 [Anisodus acutangulus]
MDRRLWEAAKKGDVPHLQSLINEDPLILRAVSLAGAFLVSILASPVVLLMNLLHLPKLYSLYAVRLVLGGIVLSTLRFFRIQIKKKFGSQVEAFFIILTTSQFHLLFYCTRPLPNILAFALVNLAYGFWFNGSLYAALNCMVFATLVFRCDILLLIAPLGLELLLTKSVSFWKALTSCLAAAFLSIGLTVLVDSFIWRRWLWPELEVFWFNSVLNRSSEWGVSCIRKCNYTFSFYVVYSKEENISLQDFQMRNFTYLLNENLYIEGFKCLVSVDGFSRVCVRTGFPPISLAKEPKVFIQGNIRNTDIMNRTWQGCSEVAILYLLLLRAVANSVLFRWLIVFDTRPVILPLLTIGTALALIFTDAGIHLFITLAATVPIIMAHAVLADSSLNEENNQEYEPLDTLEISSLAEQNVQEIEASLEEIESNMNAIVPFIPQLGYEEPTEPG